MPEGSTAADALHNSIDLARQCERLGYHRYWVAEHHNTVALAGSAPEILIGHIAAATETMRVGSGGVMLSHYSSYKVAEQFRMLHALHPDRIDLGIGRAPGSDQVTAAALAKGPGSLGIEHYPAQIRELNEFLTDTVDPNSPFGGVSATPASSGTPQLWVLASSADSASFAAHFGLPLGWADFITMADGPAIVDAYRNQYRSSDQWPEPLVLVGASAICAETDDEADRLSSSVRLWRTRALRGGIPSVEKALAAESTPDPLAFVAPNRRPMIVGGPDTVRAGIDALAHEYDADEMMLVTIVHDHAARVRSYALIAEAYGLTGS